jgi:uncharacterized membrane protein YeiH
MDVQPLVVALDWLGTFVFALSGGLLGVQKRFDLFGVLVLAGVAAIAGGVIRDLLIGAVPPAAVGDWRYLLIALAGGIITFYWYPHVQSRRRQALLFDAIGLGLFAVVGAQKAMDFGINPLMAAIMGMLTGIGGGVLRDLLAGEVPYVLRSELYALAALAAGGVVAIGNLLEFPPSVLMLVGGVVCILLRFLAINRGWRAPVANWHSPSDPE